MAQFLHFSGNVYQCLYRVVGLLIPDRQNLNVITPVNTQTKYRYTFWGLNKISIFYGNTNEKPRPETTVFLCSCPMHGVAAWILPGFVPKFERNTHTYLDHFTGFVIHGTQFQNMWSKIYVHISYHRHMDYTRKCLIF